MLQIQRRIHEKMDDYKDYSFSATEKRALMIFFDLAQEFDSLEDFLPLYLAMGPDDFVPVGRTESRAPVCSSVPLEKDFRGGHLFIPIRGNLELVDQLPFKPAGDVIGCFEFYKME
ncbi:HAMP domain-containing histidine kinase, partial [Aduncisulcus paluster]